MANLSHQPLSTVDRPLLLRARLDIQAVDSPLAGQAAYVLKDPLTLELFHLSAEEFFLFQATKIRTTLNRLRREFESRFAPRTVTTVALQEGLGQLHQRGLLLSESPAQGKELIDRAQKRRRDEWLQSLMSLLSIRPGSFDATSLVDRLYGMLRWGFSVPMLVVAMAVICYALRLLLGGASQLAAALPALAELGQPRYWLLWLGTIAAVKVVHELAHALTCKHLGGRCHEMGVMLLAFVPCLYCDVSDVWRMPNKWHRIAVSAAGMLAELLIASMALLAWWHTQPGLFNLWCLSVVMVCSVGTVLINANPLLRYDGYYLLSDLIEVPNLATRSRGMLTDKLRGWLLRQPPQPDALLGPRRRRAMLIYALAAKLYLTMLVVLIFAGLLAVARPYRVENLVYTVGMVTLVGMAFVPLRGIWQLWRNPSFRYRLQLTRVALLVGLMTGLLAMLFYWPIQRSVSGPVVFVPRGAHIVYAAVGGRLEYAKEAGSVVKQGEVIARLSDADVHLAVAQQEAEYQLQRVKHKQIESVRAWDTSASARLPTALAAMNDAQQQLAEHRLRADQLVLTAPIDGIVVAPPSLEVPQDLAGRLPTWTGSPLEPRNLGCWIEPATVVCSVGDPASLSVLVAVDEADVPEVKPGQTVHILLASSPVRVLEGEVVEVASRGTAEESAPSADARRKQHLVEVQLTSEDTLLWIGARGTAKIEAGRHTLWEIAAQQLQRMLRLPW